MATKLTWSDYVRLLRPEQLHELPEQVRIVVVDDKESILWPIVNILEEAGYTVNGFTTALEAVEYLMSRQESHIVLTDIYMEPQNGFELLTLVKDVPLFTVRACMSSDPDKEEEAYDNGATHFIDKNRLGKSVDELRPRLLRRIAPLATTVRDHDLAANDQLTGLPHIVGFIKQIKTTLAIARDFDHKPVSLLMFDGDGIKAANDAHGHDAGTAAIDLIAACLRELVGEDDMLARPFAGDEFLLLLPGTDVEEAIEIARKAARMVGGRTVTQDGNTFRVGVSVGCVTMQPHEIDDDSSVAAVQLVKMADAAMYARKRRRTKWRRAGSR